MTTARPFHFTVIVWGEAYIDAFLRFVLPNHLAPGNLQAFPDLAGSTYWIHTTAEDEARFLASPGFRRLQALMPTRLVFHPFAKGGNSYDRLIQATRQAVQTAREAGALLVTLPPDNLYSDGAFPALAEWARAGKRAVVLPGIRLTQETAGPVLLERWPPERAGELPYPPRELARIALDHLHPLSRSLCTDSERFRNEWPSHIYWRVGDAGLLCRACHLHPLMVDPGAGSALGDSTIDGAFLEELCADPADVHVVQDSDEMLALELSPRDQFPAAPPGHANPERIARFIDQHATALHRAFLEHPIRIHHGDCGPAWDAVEREAARGLARVRALQRRQRYQAEYLAGQVDERLRHWAATGARVVLHGAGEHTGRLFQWTRLAEANLVGLADGNPALQGQERFGFRVLAPAEVPALRPDAVLVSSLFHDRDIYRDIRFLEDAGIELLGLYGPLAPDPGLAGERL
jgi:hypothetical protein